MAKKYYKWVVVGLLWMVALLNYVDRQMLSVMRPAMQADIPELRSATQFGYLMAIFLWIYGLMSPFSGAIADRVSRKWLIVASLFVWSAVTLAMGHAHTFTQVYWLRAIMGISEALYIPAGLSLLADYHGSRTRSLAIGLHMTGFYIGQALGGYGAALAERFSWQSTFSGLGLIGIVYAFILLISLKEIKEKSSEKVSSFSGWKQLAVSRPFWVILFFFAVVSLPGWACRNWLPTLYAQNLNWPMSKAGPLATVTIAMASLAGVVVGGILSDWWVRYNLKGRIYTSALGLALTLPGLILLGLGHSLFCTVCAGICFGVGYGLFDANNMPILCQFISKGQRATAYGLMNMVGVFFGAAITGLLGSSSDAGRLGVGFAWLAVVVVLAIISQLALLHPQTDTDIQTQKN
ncbi:MAG: MFS transporter [Mucilaginibacter sp.]